MRTGFKALSLGKAFYIMPLLFAFSPLITGTWPEKIEVFIFAIPGFMGIAAISEGFWDIKMTIFERALFAIATILLFTQDSVFHLKSYFDLIQITNIAGVFVLALAIFIHKFRYKKVSMQKVSQLI